MKALQHISQNITPLLCAFDSVVLKRSFIKNDDHVITIIVIVMLLNGDFQDDKRILMLVKLTVLFFKKIAHYKKQQGV